VSTGVAALLLFGSGVAALVYQALWVKQLALVVGIDVHAVTTGVSAFFAGLALGSAFFGTWADRSERPLRIYVGLEIAIAATAVCTTFSFARVAPLFVRLEESAGLAAWLLPFSLIGVPAFLMGGTLPALMRALAPAEDEIGASGGGLYAANTAGGILGALLVPFVLVPTFGVQGSARAAATLNLLLAGLALAWAGRPAAPVRARAHRPASAPLALGLYAVAGGVALGYEVVWSQAIVQFLNTRAYGFALVLATYLTGLVIGSALWARIADRVTRPWLAFAVLEGGAAFSALATFGALGAWMPEVQTAVATAVERMTGSIGLATYARLLVAPMWVVLPPTILLGAAFPAAVRLACGADHPGRDVGLVLALNTFGGIAGTMLTGFVAVPMLGVRGSLLVLIVLATSVAAVALLKSWERRAVGLAAASVTIAVAVVGAAAIPKDHLARLLVTTRAGTLDAWEESAGGTVAIVREPHPAGAFRRLYIHGVSNSGDNMMSRRYMRLQALLPLIVHADPPKRALVIGLGTGITCGALLAYPNLDERVCVELLPAVKRLVHRFEGNYDVATASGVEIRLADGRHELLRDETKWDLITGEPPPPTAASIVNLYSTEFYELCRARLTPHGIVGQWLPLMTQNDEDARALVRSFLDVFPHASLWTTELHEMLLLGSMEPLTIDLDSIEARFAQPTVREALEAVGIDSVAALLATYVTDTAGLESYADGAEAVTDDRPGIEHAGFIRPGEFGRVLRNLLELRTDEPIGGADPELWAEVLRERAILTTFYQAGVDYHDRRRSEMETLLERVLEADGTNPYYRWFVGR